MYTFHWARTLSPVHAKHYNRFYRATLQCYKHLSLWVNLAVRFTHDLSKSMQIAEMGPIIESAKNIKWLFSGPISERNNSLWENWFAGGIYPNKTFSAPSLRVSQSNLWRIGCWNRAPLRCNYWGIVHRDVHIKFMIQCNYPYRSKLVQFTELKSLSLEKFLIIMLKFQYSLLNFWLRRKN